jgi:hypothetical protein
MSRLDLDLDLDLDWNPGWDQDWNRAVSDVVAYTLVFSTIIFMIGTITIGGIDTFTDVRQATETETAEATMQAYAETLADHRTEGVPRRGTTIKLQGHGLNREDSALDVSVENGGTTLLDENIETGAFVRTTETDVRLVYDSGALFRLEDGGVIVVRQPPFQCTTGTARVPLTRVNSDIAFDSTSRVTLRSTLVDQRLQYPDTRPSGDARAHADSVTIDTTNTYNAEAWNTAFEEMAGWTNTGPNEYTCSGGLDRGVVHVTEVDIGLVG